MAHPSGPRDRPTTAFLIHSYSSGGTEDWTKALSTCGVKRRTPAGPEDLTAQRESFASPENRCIHPAGGCREFDRVVLRRLVRRPESGGLELRHYLKGAGSRRTLVLGGTGSTGSTALRDIAHSVPDEGEGNNCRRHGSYRHHLDANGIPHDQMTDSFPRPFAFRLSQGVTPRHAPDKGPESDGEFVQRRKVYPPGSFPTIRRRRNGRSHPPRQS
jgi:hypothetical protein